MFIGLHLQLSINQLHVSWVRLFEWYSNHNKILIEHKFLSLNYFKIKTE